jgi:hypothetical protein
MFNISNTHFSAQFSKHGLTLILATMEHQLHAQQNEQTPPKPANPTKTETDDPKTYHLSAILIGVVRHDVKISAGRSAFCGRISWAPQAANKMQSLMAGAAMVPPRPQSGRCQNPVK